MFRDAYAMESLGFNALGRIRMSISKGRKLSASAPYVFGPGAALGLLPSIALSSARVDFDYMAIKGDWSALFILDTTPELHLFFRGSVFQLKWDPKSVALTGTTSTLSWLFVSFR